MNGQRKGEVQLEEELMWKKNPSGVGVRAVGRRVKEKKEVEAREKGYTR